MFPFAGFGQQDGWPGSRLFYDNPSEPYSDDEDYYYRGGNRARQQRPKQGHRQPIKTSADARHHPSAAGPAYSNPHHSRPVRSAPTSPHSSAAAAAFEQQQDPHLRYQRQHPQYQQQAYQQHQQQQQQQAPRTMPVHMGRSAVGTAMGAADTHTTHAHKHKHQQQAATPSRKPAARQMSPDAAATVIQTEWRRARLARHKPALKELAAAAGQLRSIKQQLRDVQRQQPGLPLTQKQYLELSEPIMKVLFALDATSCGAAELRAKRKELTNNANKLLDEIQAAYKAQPSATAAAGAGGSAGAAAAPQQQRQAPAPKHKKSGMQWFRR